MAVTPLPAASVLVLRDDPFEVLMLQRHENSSFMPNAWVFPGGISEERDARLGDGTLLSTMRVTAARETFEETGVSVDPAQLVWFSRWITPAGVPKRFDTYFFLAAVSRDQVATADQNEAVAVQWIHPADALAAHARREMQMVFPTLRTLESIRDFTSAAALIDSRRGAVIEPIEPVLVNGKPTLP